MWSEVYSQGREGGSENAVGNITTLSESVQLRSAMTAWDLRIKYGDKLKENGSNKKICFRDLAIGIYGPAGKILWHDLCY